MNGNSILTRRAGDARPLSIRFPTSDNQRNTMSDAHEVLRLFKDMPEHLLSYKNSLSRHFLEGRTKADLCEPDVVVELQKNTETVEFEPANLRRMVVSTLEKAFPEPGAELAPSEDQTALLTSLASLATMRSMRDGSEEPLLVTCWTPTPWCDMGVQGSNRQIVPSTIRHAWSGLIRPTIVIRGPALTNAKMSIVMRPEATSFIATNDPMNRLRLERDLAPMLEGIDDEAAW